MLVLSRRRGEQIRIGDSIVLSVVRVTNGRVQIGISAPADVNIHRPGSRHAPAERVLPRCISCE